MLKSNDQIAVYVTLSRTVRVETDADDMARLAGMSLETLSGIVEDGNDWEPDDDAISRIAASPTADIEDEEWDVEEISQV